MTATEYLDKHCVEIGFEQCYDLNTFLYNTKVYKYYLLEHNIVLESVKEEDYVFRVIISKQDNELNKKLTCEYFISVNYVLDKTISEVVDVVLNEYKADIIKYKQQSNK